MAEPILSNLPILILANKADVKPESFDLNFMVDSLGLFKLSNRPWFIQKCSAHNKESIMDGLNWLAAQLPEQSIIEKEDGPDKDAVEAPKSKKEEIKVVFLGCDGSGKTTLLYNLKLGSMISTIPTIGFNVETVERPDFDLSIWDVGGSSKIKALWRHYYEHA